MAAPNHISQEEHRLRRALTTALQNHVESIGSLRRAAEALNITDHASLSTKRISNISKTHLLLGIANSDIAEPAKIARDILKLRGVPLNCFNFGAATAAFEVESAPSFISKADDFNDKDYESNSDQKQFEIIGALIYHYSMANYFEELSIASLSGLRCAPQFALGRILVTEYRSQPDSDILEYVVEADGEYSVSLCFQHMHDDTEKKLTQTMENILEASAHENAFLLEDMHQYAIAKTAPTTTSQDPHVALYALAEALGTYNSVERAINSLRLDMRNDRMLARTHLGRVAHALHKEVSTRCDVLLMKFDDLFEQIPPEYSWLKQDLVGRLSISYISGKLFDFEIPKANSLPLGISLPLRIKAGKILQPK